MAIKVLLSSLQSNRRIKAFIILYSKKNTMYKVSYNLCDWNCDETTIFEICND